MGLTFLIGEEVSFGIITLLEMTGQTGCGWEPQVVSPLSQRSESFTSSRWHRHTF